MTDQFVYLVTCSASNFAGSAYDAIQQYLAHYHTERNHQGLANHLIAPEPALASHRTQVRRRERLGGVLSPYHREAA